MYAAILNVASTEMLFDGMPSTAAALEMRWKVDLQFLSKLVARLVCSTKTAQGVAELGAKVLVRYIERGTWARNSRPSFQPTSRRWGVEEVR